MQWVIGTHESLIPHFSRQTLQFVHFLFPLLWHMPCRWWNSELSSLFSCLSLIVYRFWPCTSITTQEPRPSPAVFPRHWSHFQSSTTWAGNTRYLYRHWVTFSLRWNVYRAFYVKDIQMIYYITVDFHFQVEQLSNMIVKSCKCS